MKIAKKRLNAAIKRFRCRFADQPTAALGAVLPAEVLKTAVKEEVGVFRERIYPPLTSLALWLGQALSSDGACQDAVSRCLSERTARGQRANSLNSGPYCKARQRLPLGLIRRLGVAVGTRLEEARPPEWTWRGRCVKLIDGTTISMADTAANQSVYPQSGRQAPGLGFPLAMLVALISLPTGAVLHWATGPAKGKDTGEQALFRTIMPHLDADDVILADRYYCSYFTVALLQERGVNLVTRQHARRITDFRYGKRLGRRDQLVDWIRPNRPKWMDEATYARMPERLSMRQTEVAGRILVTTLTDHRSVTPAELEALYGKRWQVEVDLRSLKTHLGMDVLNLKSPDMIDKQIAIHLLAYNLICALITRAAMGANLMARAISFKGTVQLLLAFQNLLQLGNRPTPRMNAHLIGAISCLKIPPRPGRVEPHAIKRRPKNHSLLTVPRHAARKKILRARKRYA